MSNSKYQMPLQVQKPLTVLYRQYEIYFSIRLVRFKEQQPKSGVDTDTWTNKERVFFFQISYIQTSECIIERIKVGEHWIFN